MSQSVVIKGVSFFDGVIDGQAIKSGTIHLEEALDESGGNNKGFRTIAIPASGPDLIRAVIHNEFPLRAEIETGFQVSKGSHKTIVTAIKPIARVPGNPQQQVKA